MPHFYARFFTRHPVVGSSSFCRTPNKTLKFDSLTIRLLCLLVSFSLLTPLLASASNEAQHPDYAALADFYNSTNGHGWNNSTGWLKDNNPCGWYGVGCTDGRVTELSMMYNNVTGSIPKSIGDLTYLKQIELRNNGISGTIPEEIGKLTRLEGLYLLYNQLSGPIPNSIGNLVNLKMLLLRSNQLTGSIPPSVLNMQKLESLNLAINQLSGEIPSNIGDLSSLTSIHLEQNKLTGSIPESLGKLTGMSNITLDNNELSGTIPGSLGNLTNLFQITLNNNKLTGVIPPSLGNLIHLYTLELAYNQLTGPIPDTFGDFYRLYSLSLHDNELTGSIPGSLSKLSTLADLGLYNNKLSGPIPSELGNMTNLKTLILYNNELSGSIPGNLGNLTNLRSLHLSENKLSGSIPVGLMNLINLQDMVMYDNQLTGEIPTEIWKLTSLQHLNLGTNSLSGNIPSNLGKLANLQVLSLYDNKLSGSIPNELGNLFNLLNLHISNNQLSGEIPTSLGKLSKLTFLALFGNQLSGLIPSELGSLTNLQVVFLSLNQLHGEIPNSLEKLTNLHSLYLENNKLSGTIPGGLGKLPKLEHLWLNYNQLSGCFPEPLRALCGKDVNFFDNYGLPNGGNFGAFCNREAGSNAVPAPSLTLKSGVTQPIAQNTPSVSLTVSGCEGGTINWSATNNTSGSGATIPVTTSTPGNVVYSATCTSGGCTSAPARFTVTVAAAATAGNFDGHLDGATCELFHGWVWNRDKVNAPVAVEILDGPAVIATVLADVFRQDLLNAGKGNGKHGFYFSIPASLKDGLPHTLSARVAGGSFMLKSGPKTIICPAGTTPSGNQPPVAPGVNELTAYQGTAFATVLPAFTDPENGSITYNLTNLPAGLTFNSATRQLVGTPTQTGSFVMTYWATDNQNATTTLSVKLTVNAAVSTTMGEFDGYLDKVECGTITGWAWNRNKPNAPVTIEFYTGGTIWGHTEATIYRDDLKAAGKGNGAHAYNVEVPAVLKDNQTRLISARVAGSPFVLKWSGKALTCSPTSGRLSAERGPELQVRLLGNPTTSEAIEVEVRGAAGQPLRLQLTDANGRIVSERRVEQPERLERQTLALGNGPAGMLLLRVTSGSRSVTVKVAKQ